MIDQLVNNEPYMETLAQNMHEEVVLQLVQSFTQPTWHDKLISFVNNRVSGAELSAVTCHHLLLLLISVPPKEHSLRVRTTRCDTLTAVRTNSLCDTGGVQSVHATQSRVSQDCSGELHRVHAERVPH